MEASEPYDDSARMVFTAPMRGLGLTDEERAAFERAWTDALFGTAAGQPRDALLFWLPEARVRAIASLEITPAPPPGQVRRCILVRVDLDGL